MTGKFSYCNFCEGDHEAENCPEVAETAAIAKELHDALGSLLGFITVEEYVPKFGMIGKAEVEKSHLALANYRASRRNEKAATG